MPGEGLGHQAQRGLQGRPGYSPDEGLTWRAERRAAHKPARIPLGAEPGHEQSGGLFVPGEGLGYQAQRGLQGRPEYSPDEGLT